MKPFSEIVGSSHKNCLLDLLQFDTTRNFIVSPRSVPFLVDLGTPTSTGFTTVLIFNIRGKGGGVMQTSMHKTIFCICFRFYKILKSISV